MLFNSLNFVIFLFLVVTVYYLIPSNRWRKIFLLASSYYFYSCWNLAFVCILLYVTLLSYGAAFLFENKKDKKLLTLSVILILLPLLAFKYLDFLLGTVGDLSSVLGLQITMPSVKLLLPVGISFYTFMALGYVVDVYNDKVPVERGIIDYSLFLGFFPQIASGPIGRAGQLLPQLKEKHPVLYANVAAGARMMLWGFFMKLVVGDRAGIYVDTVFGSYAHHNGGSLLLATFMYTIQIYCDFAGYSLIAIGAAKTMGYELITNFKRPYFAVSVGDFWRRWHISLSTWFRDYVYIPCGGSRVGTIKLYRNLMITFLVSGLWHGAAYTFILWGAFHGICQVLGRAFKPFKDKCRSVLGIADDSKLRKCFDIIVTFIIVSYGWMLFYAPDMQFVTDVTRGYFNIGMPYIHQTTIFFFTIGLVILAFKDVHDEFFPTRFRVLESDKCWVRYVAFAVLAVLIVLIGVLGGGQFIYFKF